VLTPRWKQPGRLHAPLAKLETISHGLGGGTTPFVGGSGAGGAGDGGDPLGATNVAGIVVDAGAAVGLAMASA